MRTVVASITTGEEVTPRHDTHALTAKNELLSFAAFTTQSNASLDTGIPQSYNTGSAAFRYTDGKAYFKAHTPSTAASWALTTTSATQLSGAGAGAEYRVMRYGYLTNAADPYLYVATHAGAAGSGIQVKRSVVSTFSPANVGTAFGPAAVATSANVTRIEAICPTSAGTIVAVGTHLFTAGYSTIQFWHISTGGTVTQLQTLIQMPLDETYSAWYSNARYAAYISAIADSSGVIHVYANAHPDGMTVQFSVRNGVESMLQSVVPVNPTYGSVSFIASSVALLGSLYYLCGRITYRWDDGTTTTFDCYLTSVDCEHWSIGERSYYLHDGNSAGTLLVDTTPTPDVVYYGGNLVAYVATLTPAQGYNLTDATQYLSLPATRLMDGTGLQQVSNNAQKFTARIDNSDGTMATSAILKAGAVLRYAHGQGGTNADIGAYEISTPDKEYLPYLNLPVVLTGYDLANLRITRYKAPVAIDYWGQDALESDLSTLDGLILKTRADDVLLLNSVNPGADLTLYDHTLGLAGTANAGLQSKALNNPLVVQADLAQANDALMKARITFVDTGSTASLPQFAFTFHGDDTGDFAGVVVPAVGSWNAKTKPRVFKSNIAPYDPATDTGGFEFEKRYQGLWASNNVGSDAYLQAFAETTSHYSTDAAFAGVAGTEYDFATRVSGRRVQLFYKARNYSTAAASTAAAYTLSQDYTWDTDALMLPDGKLRTGFALNTDVWASKTAFEHSAYADYELGLTSAKTHTGTAAKAIFYATTGLPPGVDHWARVNTNRIQCLTAGSAEVNIDLRKRFYVGQSIRVVGGTDAVYTIVSIDLQPTYYSSLLLDGDPTGATQTVYLRSGGSYAEAGSGAASTATAMDNIWVDPRPVKTVVPMLGWGAFVGNDPTAAVYDDGWVESDGVTHYRLDKGWDATNPIALPNDWKLIFHHNAIGKWRASTVEGLGTSGHFIVEQEAMRYLEGSYTPWADTMGNGTDTPVAPTAWMTYVPTHYGYPQTQTATAQRIFNQAVNGEDDFNDIANAAGLLVEITGRSAGVAESEVPMVYATGVGNVASRGYVDIDTMPAGPILDTDFVTLSGRAQFGTKKTTHPSDAPVCLYPSPIGGSAITSLVNVAHYDAYTGRYRSVEDALRYLCNLAGVRSIAFRSLMTGAANSAAHPLTLTTTPTALPLISSLSDFEIIAEAHISSSAWLQIDFRGYYRLALKKTSAGVITVGIQTTGTSIAVDGDGLRWFEKAPVACLHVTQAATVNDELRVAVVGERVTVEINGEPLWTFNMALWTHTDGTSYSVRTAGAINVSYSATVASNATTWRVPELWMPVQSITLSQGDSVSTVIKRLCDRFYIKSRPTSDGGILFTQFVARDTLPTIAVLVTDHKRSTDDDSVVPHVQSNGAKSGAYMDTARIVSDGYSFDTISQDDAETVQQAAMAARLEVREGVEYAVDDVLSAFGRVAHEVEDILPVSYTGGAASASYVITSITWHTKSSYVFAEYVLRKYQAWV